MAKEKNITLHIENFIEQVGIKQLIDMFNLMPDSLFWIKDCNSRIIHANQYFIEHLGLTSLSAVIGLNDYDFSPAHIAKQFITDDQKVMAGDIVNERLEMNISTNGETAWFITSKRQLLNEQGDIIGSYGVSRHLEKTSLALTGMDALKKPVDFIRANYMNDICLNDLAEIAHLSISALERRFKKHLTKTPKQFINEFRLENARRLLVETNLPIASIAYETGFTDHSYFSRQFRKLFGEMPSSFRDSMQK